MTAFPRFPHFFRRKWPYGWCICICKVAQRMNVTENRMCVCFMCPFLLFANDTHYNIVLVCTTTGCNMLASLHHFIFLSRLNVIISNGFRYCMYAMLAPHSHDIWVPSFKIIKMTLGPIKVQTKSQFKLYRNIWHSEYSKDQNVCAIYTHTFTYTYNPVRHLVVAVHLRQFDHLLNDHFLKLVLLHIVRANER